MSGKEAIIDKILSDAQAESDKIIQVARDKASEIISSAKSKATEFKNSEIANVEASKDDIDKRKVTVSNLEVRKALLTAKQQIIDEVFATSLDKLNSMSKADYKKLIFGMIKAEAQDGDIITVAECDKDIITKAFVADTAKKLGLNITMNKAYGSFRGGVVLSSGNYDKNSTLQVELDLLREDIEPEVANLIFGDKK